MLPMVAGEGLADYVDVFCEAKAFSVAQMERVLHTAAHYGLRGRVHVNQFNVLGGIPAAVKQHCISVDHLEVVEDTDIAALQHSNTVAMLLPSAPFFLGDHYPPARKLIDAGITVGLSSDFNPGTSPSGNMNFVVSLACIAMKMLPQEAIHAATVNNAFTLGLEGQCGVITPGALANFFVTRPMPSLAYLPYHFGTPVIQQVVLNGAL
jgi:imidazolonepropionase